jgi:hypothetical protein
MLPAFGVAFAGEFSWMFWLLLRGGKTQPVHDAAAAGAEARPRLPTRRLTGCSLWRRYWPGAAGVVSPGRPGR